jgi:hypothetical protein
MKAASQPHVHTTATTLPLTGHSYNAQLRGGHLLLTTKAESTHGQGAQITNQPSESLGHGHDQGGIT